MTTLHQASAQWASRPADERFTSLIDLRDHFRARRERSRALVVSSRSIELNPDSENGLKGLVIDHPKGQATPTNWAFGQLAQRAGAPAHYLAELPSPIAADCINYGLRFKRDIQSIGLLEMTMDGGGGELQAATGPDYGRIWNADIASTLVDRFGDGIAGPWRVPGEFGKKIVVTKANTTLYASDRDMFVFLADEERRIENPNRREGKASSLARGFFVWNSEVGDKSIGAAFFLFDYACCNRIVWGAEGFQEIRIIHTAGAPHRWIEEVTPVLENFAKASAEPIERALAAAKEAKLDELEKFLANRFGKGTASLMVAQHVAEEGRAPVTVFDAVTAVTAYARNVPNQNNRVALEREAGKLLTKVAA